MRLGRSLRGSLLARLCTMLPQDKVFATARHSRFLSFVGKGSHHRTTLNPYACHRHTTNLKLLGTKGRGA